MRQIYLVQRCHWESDELHYECRHGRDEGMPVAAFDDREAAESCRAELQYAEMMKRDPFSYSRAGVVQPVDPFNFARALNDLGIHVNDPSFQEDNDLQAWWAQNAGELTPRDARTLWGGLGGGRFFEVVAVNLEDDA